jgi:RNA polymerase sigma-70 factor (ECF subfamily)
MKGGHAVSIDGITYIPPLISGKSESLTDTNVRTDATVGPDNPSPLSNGNQSDETLLSETESGCKEALGLLFRRHRRAVFNVALRILKDASEAEDLCQEVFIFVFQRASLFDASKGSASSWIIQIAYHRAINRRRYLTLRQHYSAQGLDEQQIACEGKGPSVDSIAARKLLSQLRDQLSEVQRRTLELHYFEGYSLREIAEKTGQTLGNTRHHFYRSLERLRSSVFPEKDA